MGFGEIIGHHKQLEILRSALIKGRLHHAYLFVGLEGVGKRTVALALAKAIHCGAMTDDFCGECSNCARIKDGNHPDVRVIEPLAGKKEISIQQIRELERELNFRSFTGKCKIMILDPAVLMNLSAQNALLKTLEEPPENSLLILIAPNAGGLLPTLRSRCLRLSFGPLARGQVSDFLASRHGMKADEAQFLAAMAMGSLGAAVNLDKEELVEKRRVWIGLLSSLHAGDYQAATVAAETLASNRDEALKFLKWAESWYRDLLLHKVAPDSPETVNLDMLPQLQQQSAEHNVEHLLSSFSQAIGAAARIQRNLNRRMVLEKLLFNVVGGR
jgi:DNA polymerase-3 subunit delta'